MKSPSISSEAGWWGDERGALVSLLWTLKIDPKQVVFGLAQIFTPNNHFKDIFMFKTFLISLRNPK